MIKYTSKWILAALVMCGCASQRCADILLIDPIPSTAQIPIPSNAHQIGRIDQGRFGYKYLGFHSESTLEELHRFYIDRVSDLGLQVIQDDVGHDYFNIVFCGIRGYLIKIRGRDYSFTTALDEREVRVEKIS